VNALRLLGALMGRPEVRGNAPALRALLPPLLQPLLDLLRPPGCARSGTLQTQQFCLLCTVYMQTFLAYLHV
jgi:hypothetical protein